MNTQIIHHWGSYFGARTLDEHARRHPNGMLDRTAPADGVAAKPRAVARVSGSCWIADCPSGDGGAEFVNFDEPLFFCCRCRNAAWDHKPLQIKVPTVQKRAAIEAVLLNRDDPDTRNWVPGEDVADLKVENLIRGVRP
jgi:hypothetical protein